MILFDTNVISELVKPESDPVVLMWAARLEMGRGVTTSINVAELLGGLAWMPAGKRRHVYHARAVSFFSDVLGNRILSFDASSAEIFADMQESMKARGRAIGFVNAQIAAIALQHGCPIATRDEQPFRDAGLDVVDPWQG
jgi:toxin FitB